MQFNASQYNVGLYGIDGTIAPVFSTNRLVFDGFSLSDGDSMLLSRLSYSGPSREIIGGNIPRGHGQYFNAAYYRELVIEASGTVIAASASALETQLDLIRKRLSPPQANLDLTDDAGTVKRFTATLTNPESLFPERQHYHVSFCPFVARFACKTPFGRARDYTAQSTALASSPQNVSVYHAGTVDAQAVIALVFDSATSVTTVNVKRIDANGNTLDEIEYSGSIAAGDVLVLDGEAKTVKKNEAEVRYDGSFLTLPPGSSLIKYTIDGTFSATVTDKHRSTFL